jgi:hypothetical protein
MRRMLVLAAVVEAATGVALLLAPSLVGQWLFGVELTGIAMTLARVTGIALVALAVACYPGEAANRGLSGMLAYSWLAALYLIYLGLGGEWVGILLWPAVGFHAVLTYLLAGAWLKGRPIRGTEIRRN